MLEFVTHSYHIPPPSRQYRCDCVLLHIAYLTTQNAAEQFNRKTLSRLAGENPAPTNPLTRNQTHEAIKRLLS